jgi:hypothetical protein
MLELFDADLEDGGEEECLQFRRLMIASGQSTANTGYAVGAAIPKVIP